MSIIKSIARIIINKTIWFWPHKYAHTFLYWDSHEKKRMDWNNPRTYDELIHFLIVNKYDSAYAKYADKFKVREYVRKCGLDSILIPLLCGPCSSLEDINIDTLPNEFVIKTTHASGPEHYYICNNKSQISNERLKSQFDRALKENFAKVSCEYHYSVIQPQIIVEKLLHDSTERMNDYKVVCSYGTPIAILVCSDRDEGRDYFDLSWKPLYFTKEEFRSKSPISKPKHFEKMINAASILSEPFPLSRIDFYDIDEGLYFGEITLSPSAGSHINLTEVAQIELRNRIVNVINIHDHNIFK